MCLMSSLETLYELREVTDYIIANEDYCPWNGVISPEFLSHFEQEVTGAALIQKIVQSSFDQNENIKDPADLTVVYAPEIGRAHV